MVENNESKPQDGILDSAAAEKATETIDVEKILEKYDRESTTRTLNPSWKTIVKVICILFSLFQLYTAAWSIRGPDPALHTLGFCPCPCISALSCQDQPEEIWAEGDGCSFALLGLQ